MIKEYRDKIAEGGCTASEITLLGICLLLIGIIIGMIIAPVRFGIYGSFNGNQGKIKIPGKKSGKHKDKAYQSCKNSSDPSHTALLLYRSFNVCMFLL